MQTGGPLPTWTPRPPTPACGAGWRAVALPAVPPSSTLAGVAAPGPADLWAVGEDNFHGAPAGTAGPAPRAQALIMHGDGHAWRAVPAADPGAPESTLAAVTALAARDVWAVGRSVSAAGAPHTLTEHGDGRAWRVVPSPNGAAGSSYLAGVAGTGAGDVWAVGGTGLTPLVLHWDGQAWSRAADAALQVGGGLAAVAALAPDDVWAVGEHGRGETGWSEHWDGRAWHTVAAAAAFAPRIGQMNAVTVAGGTDLWAVGRRGYAGEAAAARYFDPGAGRRGGGGSRGAPPAEPPTAEPPTVEPLATPPPAPSPAPLSAPAPAAQPPPPAALAPVAAPGDPAGRYFPAVDHTLRGRFRAYWEAHGGLAVAGYPISAAFDEVSPTNGQVYQVQYFERARDEAHPELPAPFAVSQGLLGVPALGAAGWRR